MAISHRFRFMCINYFYSAGWREEQPGRRWKQRGSNSSEKTRFPLYLFRGSLANRSNSVLTLEKAPTGLADLISVPTSFICFLRWSVQRRVSKHNAFGDSNNRAGVHCGLQFNSARRDRLPCAPGRDADFAAKTGHQSTLGRPPARRDSLPAQTEAVISARLAAAASRV